MDKMSKGKMMGMEAPDLSAKKDVLQALRKMAMQLMSEGHDEDGAVMAKVQMKKLDPNDMDHEQMMGQECESPEEDASESGEELDPKQLMEMLKQLK